MGQMAEGQMRCLATGFQAGKAFSLLFKKDYFPKQYFFQTSPPQT
jgi:hypothetical protein